MLIIENHEKPEAKLAAASPKRAVRLADIAKALGTDKSSVSRALADKPGVSLRLKEQIRTTAQHMGYEPDPMLDAFNYQRRVNHGSPASTTMAVLMDLPSRRAIANSRRHAGILAGIRAKCHALGFTLDLVLYGSGAIQPGRLSQILTARGIPCAIIAAPVAPLDFSALRTPGLDCLLLETHHDAAAVDTICTDFHQCTRLAMSRLRALGCQRIGYVHEPAEETRAGHQALSSYLFESGAGSAPHDIPPWVAEKDKGPLTMGMLAPWLRTHQIDGILGLSQAMHPLVNTTNGSLPGGLPFASLIAPTDCPHIAGTLELHAELGALAVEFLSLRRHDSTSHACRGRSTSYLPGIWRSVPQPAKAT